MVTEHEIGDKPNDWLIREDRDWDISLVSRSQVMRANGECIASRRRELFSKYLAQLKGLSALPLFSELPHDVAPYIFLLLLDKPTRDFAPLKQAALPLYRWEEMAVTDCTVADDYRQRLVKLPCHQSLSDYEVAWMIAKLRELL
ncbi:MAG: hypothetical protein ABW079_01680 [Sedimenticola sp.]